MAFVLLGLSRLQVERPNGWVASSNEDVSISQLQTLDLVLGRHEALHDLVLLHVVAPDHLVPGTSKEDVH